MILNLVDRVTLTANGCFGCKAISGW